MSIRHQMRQKVEKLFKLMIDDPDFPGDETVVYVVFTPQEGDYTEEDVEVSEQAVDLGDQESVKKFLDRTTREALEADVKGLKLSCYVFEGKGGLKIVSEEEVDQETVLSRIERMREEV
ncbi:MAG: hypothetical protein Q9N26_07845 [Aquificota bacterium]|nr:hypothetical protein [Aquificota bacterium]